MSRVRYQGEQAQAGLFSCLLEQLLITFWEGVDQRMKELFDKIMSIDQQANQRLKEAVKQKEEEALRVAEQKQQLEREMEAKAKSYLAKLEASEQQAADEVKSEIDQKAEEERKRLEKIYRGNREEWVSTVVLSVLKASEK